MDGRADAVRLIAFQEDVRRGGEEDDFGVVDLGQGDVGSRFGGRKEGGEDLDRSERRMSVDHV